MYLRVLGCLRLGEIFNKIFNPSLKLTELYKIQNFPVILNGSLKYEIFLVESCLKWLLENQNTILTEMLVSNKLTLQLILFSKNYWKLHAVCLWATEKHSNGLYHYRVAEDHRCNLSLIHQKRSRHDYEHGYGHNVHAAYQSNYVFAFIVNPPYLNFS